MATATTPVSGMTDLPVCRRTCARWQSHQICAAPPARVGVENRALNPQLSKCARECTTLCAKDGVEAVHPRLDAGVEDVLARVDKRPVADRDDGLIGEEPLLFELEIGRGVRRGHHAPRGPRAGETCVISSDGRGVDADHRLVIVDLGAELCMQERPGRADHRARSKGGTWRISLSVDSWTVKSGALPNSEVARPCGVRRARLCRALDPGGLAPTASNARWWPWRGENSPA
eukprot:954936-Pleurochrysis_carterae.AAC.2